MEEGYPSHEDGPWVPPGVDTEGRSRVGRWEVQGAHSCLREDYAIMGYLAR